MTRLKDIYPDGEDFVDCTTSKTFRNLRAKVIFDDFLSELYKCVKEYDAAFGVMAWIRHKGIISMLKNTNTSLLVQKEKFKPGIIDLYKGLKNKYYFRNVDGMNKYVKIFRQNNYPCNTPIGTIRMVGSISNNSSHPEERCHDKFVVFYKEAKKGLLPYLIPKSVWVGSFNFTYTATKGFDTALLITDDAVAKHFHDKYVRIYGISEELTTNASREVMPQFKVVYDAKQDPVAMEKKKPIKKCSMLQKNFMRYIIDFKSIKITECSDMIEVCPMCSKTFCSNHLFIPSEWFSSLTCDEYICERMCIACAKKVANPKTNILEGIEKIEL